MSPLLRPGHSPQSQTRANRPRKPRSVSSTFATSGSKRRPRSCGLGQRSHSRAYTSPNVAAIRASSARGRAHGSRTRAGLACG